MLVSNKYTNGALDPTGTQVYQGVKQVLTSNGVSYFNWSGYVNNSLYPYTTETFNIGDSTHQWNNLYAKNYYYNGTAWGLDKENVWSNINSYTREICISGDRNAYIAPMWEGASSGLAFLNSDATKTFVFGQYTTDANNRKAIDSTKGRLLIRTGERNGETVLDFEPRATNAILGTATNPFKTINGVNPGALSIFNPSASYDPIDIPTSWDTLGASWNTLSVSNLGDGWLCITYNNCSAGDYILVRFGGTSGSSYPSLRFEAVKNSNNKYFIYALFPVAKAFSNIYLEMLINSNANLILHHYIPAYGTV